MLNLAQSDKPRFLCSLFVAEPARACVQAVLAWNAEVAKIADVVSEPMLGHIRFTWWREALDEIYAGKPARKHPVAEALAPLTSTLTRMYFDAILDAREAALDEEITDMQGYAHATGGALARLCAEAMSYEDVEAADKVGTLYALTGLGQLSVVGDQGSDDLPAFFTKQITIANYWQKHPETVKKSTLPFGLLLRLMF